MFRNACKKYSSHTYASGQRYILSLMTSHKFFTAYDEHRNDRIITHTRDRTRTCVYAQRLKRNLTRNFWSQLNRILKTEPVQIRTGLKQENRNRFRRNTNRFNKTGTGSVGFDISKWTSLITTPHVSSTCHY